MGDGARLLSYPVPVVCTTFSLPCSRLHWMTSSCSIPSIRAAVAFKIANFGVRSPFSFSPPPAILTECAVVKGVEQRIIAHTKAACTHRGDEDGYPSSPSTLQLSGKSPDSYSLQATLHRLPTPSWRLGRPVPASAVGPPLTLAFLTLSRAPRSGSCLPPPLSLARPLASRLAHPKPRSVPSSSRCTR